MKNLRHIAIDSLYNFRDAGGYEAKGGSVRWGALYRSDSLEKLDALVKLLVE